MIQHNAVIVYYDLNSSLNYKYSISIKTVSQFLFKLHYCVVNDVEQSQY